MSPPSFRFFTWNAMASLDVEVPVGPVVRAGILLVVVWNVHRFQVGVEGPVLVEQEVLGPAVDSHRRDPAVVDLLDDGERVFRASGRLLAEDPDELRG